MTAAEFLARNYAAAAPVIDGLLDAEDRAIFAGPEGFGKTTLLLQLGIGKAIGIHPFAGVPMDAGRGRVLWLDLENRRSHIDAQLRKFAVIAERYGPWDGRSFIVSSQRTGVNLARATDRARVAAVIRAAKPDLIIGGPIYKMVRASSDRQNAEEVHGEVTGFWDAMQERFGFALVLETHQPGQTAGAKRVSRPIGSSIYQRWPEFGFTLAPAGKGVLRLDRNRGDRVEGRNWPVKVERNRMPGGGWPWVATFDPALVQDVLAPGETQWRDQDGNE